MKRKNLELSCILLGRALKKLREACDKAEKQNEEMEIYRDATIQRFEFTVELFWKSLKKILEYEKIDANTPRAVLKESYQVGLIDDEKKWLMVVEDRNRSSHTYSEKAAKEIYERIKSYVPFLEKSWEQIVKKYDISETEQS